LAPQTHSGHVPAHIVLIGRMHVTPTIIEAVCSVNLYPRHQCLCDFAGWEDAPTACAARLGNSASTSDAELPRTIHAETSQPARNSAQSSAGLDFAARRNRASRSPEGASQDPP
jgi:hypothetical protein